MQYLGKIFLPFLYSIFLVSFSRASEKSLLKSIENYLNNHKTITAKFKQVTLEDNKVKKGVLYILKPGKLRFEYLNPKKITIVLNNNNIMYHDHELDETSYTKENNYFFKLLASQKISLQSDVSRVVYDKDNIILHINKHTNNIDANIVVTFATNPITLKDVMFKSNNQVAYRLFFYDIEYNKSLSTRLFSVQNPKFYSAPY